MKKLIFFLILLIGIALYAPRSLAQENVFQEEVQRMLAGAFNPLERDNLFLWHGAGSKWKLTSSERAPDDFAEHMDGFVWQGARLLFSSNFCQERNYGFKNYIFSGHLDLSQASNNYNSPRIILSTLPKDRAEEGCSEIKNVREFLGAAPIIEYSSTNNGEVRLVFFDSHKKTFKLVYQRDHKAESLLQSKWKLASNNLSPAKKCGPLTIRPWGTSSQAFVESFEFYVDGAGWWPHNPNKPLVVSGCSNANEEAEASIKSKLKNGFDFDSFNRLIVDPQSNDPVIFEPAAVLSDIEGKYKLTGLELRSYNRLFQASPKERKISDRKALKKLGFKLEVKETQLLFSSKCRTHTGDVFRRKSDVILIEKGALVRKQDCKSTSDVLKRISSHMGTIVGKNAVVKITYDETTKQLTLTRGFVGSATRSLNWIFERQ